MKITKVDVFEVHTRRPAWRPVLCRIYTDEGIYGDGEAALAYGTAAPAAAGMIRDLATLIIGMDPLDNEVIWDKLYKSTFWGQNGGPVVFSGISALDIALWDIKGKYFRVPIYKLLGGKRRDNLRTYASQLQFGWGDVCRDSVEMSAPHNAATIADYVENARKAVAEGYDCIKIDFFTFAPEDGHRYTDEDRTRLLPPEKVHMIEERVAAVREAIGPDVDIIMVPVVGLEPTRCCHQRILNPSRLPIPSYRQRDCKILYTTLKRLASLFDGGKSENNRLINIPFPVEMCYDNLDFITYPMEGFRR